MRRHLLIWSRIQQGMRDLRASFWFVPANVVAGAALLALVLIEVDTHIQSEYLEPWPRVFGAGADGSRALLTSVAGSMITVAGVVFSITVVALALASSQYTSRVLRNFMSDRTNQSVLGVFVGVYVYCLVVVRTIRGGDEGDFVPSVAVLAGLILALVGIGFLIYFIHHISISIQVSHVLSNIACETHNAVERLFPDDLGDEDEAAPEAEAHRGPWQGIPAKRTGYVQHVDNEALLTFATEHDLVLRMKVPVGGFAIEGLPWLSAAKQTGLTEEEVDRLQDLVVVGLQRTIDQDASFGIRQMVDIALRALSPGINDTTTAVMCIDYLTANLAHLAGRSIPSRFRSFEGELRVIALGSDFESLVNESFDEIRRSANGNVTILSRLLSALGSLEIRTISPWRRRILLAQVEAVLEAATRTIPAAAERIGVEQSAHALAVLLKGPPSGRGEVYH